jgi:hypothetical protein
MSLITLILSIIFLVLLFVEKQSLDLEFPPATFWQAKDIPGLKETTQPTMITYGVLSSLFLIAFIVFGVLTLYFKKR